MTPKEIGTLLIYASRYAIGRHTYASSEMAALAKKLSKYLSVEDREVLKADIYKASKERGAIDELSEQQWMEVLEVLGGTKNG
jgi:hypothetical protein